MLINSPLADKNMLADKMDLLINSRPADKYYICSYKVSQLMKSRPGDNSGPPNKKQT